VQAAELADKLGDTIALAHAALGFCGPHRFEPASAVSQPIAALLRRALAALGRSDTPIVSQISSTEKRSRS
jgi:hypothetical protein